MLSHSRTVSRGLILISVVLSLHHVSGRYVKPITFGYELGTPLNDILPVVSDQVGDLSISAAEPRPVIVELVKAPLSLPLVADAGTTSAQSDAPVISASEKVVKVLRKPMAFSYTNQADQANAASDHVADSPKEPLQGVESKHRVDQQPAAIDYYKYLARLQGEEKDGGAAVQKDGVEAKKEEGQNKDGADLRQKSKPNLFLNHSPTHFHSELAHKPVVDFHKSHYEAIPTVDAGGKAEASESHEEQEGGHADSQGSGSNDGHKEEIQASASHHGGGNAYIFLWPLGTRQNSILIDSNR